MSRIWITSDHHFNHANIIAHVGRPFTSADEMNRVMIANWNAVVRDRDEVWFLGDFAMRCSADLMQRIFTSLRGRKILIPGNHDGKRTLRLGWERVCPPIVERVFVGSRERRVVLCHYPLRSWSRRAHGAWHLHGHSHRQAPEDRAEQGILDVGVDSWGFTPISWETIERELESREL